MPFKQCKKLHRQALVLEGVSHGFPDQRLHTGLRHPVSVLHSAEALWGRTIGKLVTGTKCVSMDGGNASIGQVLGRPLIRFVPFEAFSFLFGSELVRGWHDRAPNTKVVMVR